MSGTVTAPPKDKPSAESSANTSPVSSPKPAASHTVHKAQSNSPFLTVSELAQLLHVNEKKIYQLAGEGDIPGTKITGKWIFPRHLIEDWVSENSHGGALSDRLIIAGSDDRLLKQICNETALELQHSAMLGYSPNGTRHGLRMLDTRRADACFINWGASDASGRRHLGLLRAYKNHRSWIVVRCLQRSQGLLLSHDLYSEDMSPETLIQDKKLRWALRNSESGSERLLQDLCASAGCDYSNLNAATTINTERSAAGAVSKGDADITCGTEATAHELQLAFVHLAKVSIDLVMTRRTYFRTVTQSLLASLIKEQNQALAGNMRGYSLIPSLEVLALDSR